MSTCDCTMANPDDEDFDQFVLGVMDASFSTVVDEIEDDEQANIILNNVSDSDESDDSSGNRSDNSGRPIPMLQPSISHDQWNNVTANDPGPSRIIPIYNVNKGLNLPSTFDSDSKPIDYFQLFFNNDIIDYIVDETNIFANKRLSTNISPHSRLKKWKNIQSHDLNAFIGVIINMGIMNVASLEDYFCTKWESRIPFYSDTFSKNDFLNLFWQLHFNHDRGQGDARPKGFLIQPIMDHINRMNKLFYTTTNHVAVDESTISFKGKVSFRIYNPQKPTKFGMKIFVLSDCANGYIYDMIPYYGKQSIIPNSSLLKTTQIVKTMCQSVVMKDSINPTSGLHVYTDRYYTSPELADELLKIGCNLTGTVMPTRVGMPKNLKVQCKKMKKGCILSQRKGDKIVVSWRDKRVVHMLSTKHKGSKNDVTDVPSKWPNNPPTSKPNVVVDYTKHMGAVDRSDNFISSYQFMRKSKKWYRKTFFWLLEVAIVNSYILHKEVQKQHQVKPMTHHQFRKSLVRDLVAERMALPTSRSRRGRPIRPGQTIPTLQRLNGKPHFMQKRPKGSARCVVCLKKGLRKETIFYCKTCDDTPALHPEVCMEAYHTMNDY